MYYLDYCRINPEYFSHQVDNVMDLPKIQVVFLSPLEKCPEQPNKLDIIITCSDIPVKIIHPSTGQASHPICIP